jgi:hypothetical protein
MKTFIVVVIFHMAPPKSLILFSLRSGVYVPSSEVWAGCDRFGQQFPEVM